MRRTLVVLKTYSENLKHVKDKIHGAVQSGQLREDSPEI